METEIQRNHAGRYSKRIQPQQGLQDGEANAVERTCATAKEPGILLPEVRTPAEVSPPSMKNLGGNGKANTIAKQGEPS